MADFGLLPSIEEEVQKLEKTIYSLKDLGEKFAIAQRDYNVILNVKSLEMKANNLPATFITNIVKGDKDVAEARLKRDIAETNYDTAKEYLQIQKLKLRLMEAQVSREFGVSKYD